MAKFEPRGESLEPVTGVHTTGVSDAEGQDLILPGDGAHTEDHLIESDVQTDDGDFFSRRPKIPLQHISVDETLDSSYRREPDQVEEADISPGSIIRSFGERISHLLRDSDDSETEVSPTTELYDGGADLDVDEPASMIEVVHSWSSRRRDRKAVGIHGPTVTPVGDFDDTASEDEFVVDEIEPTSNSGNSYNDTDRQDIDPLLGDQRHDEGYIDTQQEQGPTIVGSLKQRLQDRKDAASAAREAAAVEQAQREEQQTRDNQYWLSQRNAYEQVELASSLDGANRHAYFAGNIEPDMFSNLPTFDQLRFLTRVAVADELTQRTHVVVDLPNTDQSIQTQVLHDIEKAQMQALQSTAHRNGVTERGVSGKPLDLATELNPEPRDYILRRVTAEPRRAYDAALVASLPYIYQDVDVPTELTEGATVHKVIHEEKDGSLTPAELMERHRERSALWLAEERGIRLDDELDPKSGEVLGFREMDIVSRSRQIKVYSRYYRDKDGTIRPDPRQQGYAKLTQGARVENVDPGGKDLRLSGTWKGPNTDGGYTIDVAHTGIDVAQLTPAGDIYPDDRGTSTRLTPVQTSQADPAEYQGEFPDVIAEYTLETRKVTDGVYASLVDAAREREERRRQLHHGDAYDFTVDPELIALRTVSELYQTVLPRLDEIERGLQIATQEGSQAMRDSLEERGLGFLLEARQPALPRAQADQEPETQVRFPKAIESSAMTGTILSSDIAELVRREAAPGEFDDINSVHTPSFS